MSNSFIQDGTGRGYLVRVDEMNRMRVFATTQPTLEAASEEGEAFNVNTDLVSITVGTETPLFFFENNESSDVTLAAWFIGTGVAGGTPTDNIEMAVYANPTAVSGGVAVTPQNRRIGAGRTFSFDCLKQDSGTPLLATLPSVPVLFQYQTAQARVFGEIYLTLPRGASVVVTIKANGAQTLNVYTGFSGYVN